MNKKLSTNLVLGFVALFAVLLGLLHILEPEFNLDGHLISEYELGQYGWLMTLAFWSLAGASLTLWIAIKDDLQTLGGRIGKWWLLLIALAYLGAGLFYPDTSTGLGMPENPADLSRAAIAPTLNASLHGFSGVIVIASSPIVFTLLARSLSRNPQWATKAKSLRWVTWLTWIGLLSFPVSMVLYSVLQQPGGFDFRDIASVANRLMILAYAGWMAAAARQKKES